MFRFHHRGTIRRQKRKLPNYKYKLITTNWLKVKRVHIGDVTILFVEFHNINCIYLYFNKPVGSHEITNHSECVPLLQLPLTGRRNVHQWSSARQPQEGDASDPLRAQRGTLRLIIVVCVCWSNVHSWEKKHTIEMIPKSMILLLVCNCETRLASSLTLQPLW